MESGNNKGKRAEILNEGDASVELRALVFRRRELIQEIREKLLELQQESRKREQVWYQRYFEIAMLLKAGSFNRDDSIPNILWAIDRMMNEGRAYHTETIARSAEKSIRLVIKDLGLERKS